MRTHLLYPDSKAPREQQYALAWGLLEKHAGYEDATEAERAHAKCWLTYRAADGAIHPQAYWQKIDPVIVLVTDKEESARWGISQRMARCCVELLTGADQWKLTAVDVFDDVRRFDWHPSILSVVRAGALLAYEAYLRGDNDKANKWIELTWGRWQRMAATIPWALLPWRAMEAQDDLVALHALGLIGLRSGAVMPQPVPAAFAADYVFSERAAVVVPFIRCLRKLSVGADADKVIFGKASATWLPPKHPVEFTFAQTPEQKALWAKVKAAGVTRVCVASGLTTGGTTNLGDDVQSLAAMLWCGLSPNAESSVVRDLPMNWPKGETVLMSGWFGFLSMPPPEVRVIVCGLHVWAKDEAKMLAAGTFEQLRDRVKAQGFPAGCRDMHTVRLLQKYDIPAVFSGCVTSTLPVQTMFERVRLLSIDAPPEPGFEAEGHTMEALRHASIDQRLQAADLQLHKLACCQELRTSRLHAALPALAMGCPKVTLFLEDVTNPERWEGYI